MPIELISESKRWLLPREFQTAERRRYGDGLTSRRAQEDTSSHDALPETRGDARGESFTRRTLPPVEGGEGDQEARRLFNRLLSELERPEYGSPPADRHLKQWMQYSLAGTFSDLAVDVRTSQNECDLVVADTVGIEIVDGLAGYGQRGLRRHLKKVDHDYVIVFVHALPGASQDTWWLTKQRCTPRALDVHGVGFVKPTLDNENGPRQSPVATWTLLGPIVLAVAVYLAVGLAESSQISNHPMLELIVPVIGVTVFLVFVLKVFART